MSESPDLTEIAGRGIATSWPTLVGEKRILLTIAERDGLIEEIKRLRERVDTGPGWRRMADQREQSIRAQSESYRAALERIAALKTPGGHGFGSMAKGIARAALDQEIKT